MNKKEIKRREEKEENNKSKNYIKKGKPKNIRVCKRGQNPLVKYINSHKQLLNDVYATHE